MSPTQPSEQEECPKCGGERDNNRGVPCFHCKRCAYSSCRPEPSPEQDWKQEFDLLDSYEGGGRGKMSTLEIKAFITTEKAKSYEAGQRDKVVEVRRELEKCTGFVKTGTAKLIVEVARPRLHIPSSPY